LEVGSIDNALMKVFGKGSKERVVPIGRTALRWLESYLKAIRPNWQGNGQHKAVFLNRIGKPLNWQNLYKIVKQRCAVTGRRISPRTFRRSCTIELIRNNANLYHVKDLLGHESIETLRPYTKLTIRDLKKTHAACHPREKDE